MAKAADTLSMNRSALIRTAVEDYLRKLRQAALEEELAEGYLANAEQAQKSAQDFRYVDSELI